MSLEHILDIAFAFRKSKALLSAVELRLFDVLAEGPQSAHDLTGRLGLHGRGARDFLDALVALKLLDPILSRHTELRSRFLREAQLASGLDHPNICTIHEVGEAAGEPYIAMQYIEGETLRQIRNDGPLALESMLSISLQVADALAEAHENGIVHRDIKPNNILVTEEVLVKLIDFVIAKQLLTDEGGTTIWLTHSGQRPMTPEYASPEQIQEAEVTPATDV